MQPVLPSIEYQIDDPGKPISLYVVNDFHREFQGAVLKWRISGPDGSGQVATRSVNIASDSAARIADLGPLPEVSSGSSTLEVWIEASDGSVLGRNSLSKADFVKASPEPRNKLRGFFSQSRQDTKFASSGEFDLGGQFRTLSDGRCPNLKLGQPSACP